MKNKTWFVIDGSLETIDFDGPSCFRYPLDLVIKVIEEFCPAKGSVFDPFVGFGTTLVAEEKTGRWGVGFELDKQRADFAQKQISPRNKVINDRIFHAEYASGLAVTIKKLPFSVKTRLWAV